jgi:RNA polymerase sigma-70 factor (ECF subfamily)
MDSKTDRTPAPPKADFEELVKEYGDYLYRQAYLRTGRAETAEDLVQETFLAAIQNMAGFEGRSSVKTWLMGILRNKIVDHFRKSGREESFAFDDMDEQRSRDFLANGSWRHFMHRWDGSPEDKLEQKGFMAALENCIMALPERIRQVLMLKVLDNFDSSQICKEVGISTSNVWVTIYRARMQLRGCMEANWYRAKGR